MARRTRGILARPFAFWDASALVPLCVAQGSTTRAVSFYKKYEAVIWWGTPVEVASALGRLLRMKQLAPVDWAQSRRLAADLTDACFVINPSAALRSRAMQMLEKYDLRAADALQLAAGLEWCEDEPRSKVFLTADQKLHDAAALRGFNVELV
jgi:predicted nucleic acid-binding protein